MNAKLARTTLEHYLTECDHKVTTIVRHVSQSGQERAIQVLIAPPALRGDVLDVSYLVAAVTSYSLHLKHAGLKVRGCGMDMTFHLVYSLSQTLYSDGYKIQNRTL